MLLMVEKGIRRGISVIKNRHGKSNNPYMREKYNKNEPDKIYRLFGCKQSLRLGNGKKSSNTWIRMDE